MIRNHLSTEIITNDDCSLWTKINKLEQEHNYGRCSKVLDEEHNYARYRLNVEPIVEPIGESGEEKIRVVDITALGE